jgi:hypothetical protein
VDSEGLLRAGFSGDDDDAVPVQSAGMLTPLVPLLGTVGRKKTMDWRHSAVPAATPLLQIARVLLSWAHNVICLCKEKTCFVRSLLKAMLLH